MKILTILIGFIIGLQTAFASPIKDPLPDEKIDNVVKEDHNVVAMVFDKPIYVRDITPSEALENTQKDVLSGPEYNDWLLLYKQQHVQTVIWKYLGEHLLKSHGMTPTEKEIEIFLVFLEKRQMSHFIKLKEHQAVLMKKIKEGSLIGDKRKNLTKKLELVNNTIDKMALEQDKINLNPAYASVKKVAMRRAAEMAVTKWYFHKALFDKYGGRSISQPYGLEPIDAFNAFVAELRQNNRVVMMDSSLGVPFTEMGNYLNQDYDYVDEDKTREFFNKPWWLK